MITITCAVGVLATVQGCTGDGGGSTSVSMGVGYGYGGYYGPGYYGGYYEPHRPS